jgi:hypothetical protein
MSELPTASTPAIKTTTETSRALADIEAAKLLTGPDVAECLDAIGDLIRITGQPSAVLAWAVDFLSREELRVFAQQHGLTLHESCTPQEELPRAAVIWTASGTGRALIPAGQCPATTLLHLRAEIAQREEDDRRARDFQESVAIGYVETLADWDARITPAGK